MREGDTGIRGTAGRGGNSRNHLKRNTLGRQRIDFLSAATEDEGIAALEAHHPLALLGQPHQQMIDVFLRQRVIIALLAGINTPGVAPHQRQHRR